MKNLYMVILILALAQVSVAQCYKDRHNTSWNEGWISCQESPNPNTERGQGHWILYDFGNTYRLGNVHLWNLNNPDLLESGFKDFSIDYSQDGESWNNLGQYTLEQATGLSTYEGLDITSFSGDTARYVLLTAQNNWGGECSGLAEVRFEVVEMVSKLHVYDAAECVEVAIFPNPHTADFTLNIRPKCQGRIKYGLYDHTGKLILEDFFAEGIGLTQRQISTEGLSTGLYHLVLSQNGKVSRYPVMKIK